jgi:hypothetical protein
MEAAAMEQEAMKAMDLAAPIPEVVALEGMGPEELAEAAPAGNPENHSQK